MPIFYEIIDKSFALGWEIYLGVFLEIIPKVGRKHRLLFG